jgi:predicted Fe-Mo cluster-binding NifX family protein
VRRKLRKVRIAVPTKGEGGLSDVVSDVFGRAITFTIVDIEEGVIKNVDVLENPAVSYEHGAGPIVVKMLMDARVNKVIAAEFGPGVSTLLDQHKVARITVHAGSIVTESIKDVLTKARPPRRFKTEGKHLRKSIL